MSYIRLAMAAGVAILLGLCVLFYANWQRAREDVGSWKTAYDGKETEVKGLRNQLTEANNKINSTAKAGAVSYGQCQDLAANDASKNFDMGVAFGRATCPAATSSPSPVSR